AIMPCQMPEKNPGGEFGSIGAEPTKPQPASSTAAKPVTRMAFLFMRRPPGLACDEIRLKLRLRFRRHRPFQNINLLVSERRCEHAALRIKIEGHDARNAGDFPVILRDTVGVEQGPYLAGDIVPEDVGSGERGLHRLRMEDTSGHAGERSAGKRNHRR